MNSLIENFDAVVLKTYGRYPVAFTHGAGCWLYNEQGDSYLDLCGGIAVNCLGHAHPEMIKAITEQAGKLIHTSNLYIVPEQEKLAARLVKLIGPGKIFFCNSGGEANEGLFKLTRKFGQGKRYKIVTTFNSFHGRTLAGIAATGQDKIKKGFDPAVPGFIHVPFNDLESMRTAVQDPEVAAVLIEGIQGEGGITPATPEYLLGLRALCDERNLLLLLDEVQAGHYRTGAFHSYQTVLKQYPNGDKFTPDGISMAKALGGGFPIGAFWVADKYCDIFTPGSHGSTYGGNPLACAVALAVLDTIEKQSLQQNAAKVGALMLTSLSQLVKEFPKIFSAARGFGLMIGLQVQDSLKMAEKTAAAIVVEELLNERILTVPAGANVIRILPAYIISEPEIKIGIEALRKVAVIASDRSP